MAVGLQEISNAVRQRAAAFVLRDLGVIQVEGEDRLSWLNGMVTNDVAGLAEGERLPAAVVSVKGKLQALVDLWRRADDVLVVTHCDGIARLRESLEKLIVMEDVVTTDATADWAIASVQGPAAAGMVGGAGLVGRPADRSGSGGIDLLLPRPDLPRALSALLAAGAVEGSDEVLDLLRLEAGIPRWGVDVDDDLFPQEARIEDQRVSFQKGCYVGQEVVMRLQLRGHANRLLSFLDLGDAAPPSRDTPVIRDGAEVGKITSAAKGPTVGRTIALALLRREAAAPGSLLEVAGRPASVQVPKVPRT